jgi:hypothetical protein
MSEFFGMADKILYSKPEPLNKTTESNPLSSGMKDFVDKHRKDFNFS